MHQTLQALVNKQWRIRLAQNPALCLPKSITDRYPGVPAEVTAFLLQIEEACNAEENVWFLSSAHYARSETTGFRWNEYEHMEMEYEDDSLERRKISSFWDSHLPFMLSVHSDYDYLAVRLSPSDFGSIVHGHAPFWREPDVIAPSFDVFLSQLMISTGASEPDYPYSYFI